MDAIVLLLFGALQIHAQERNLTDEERHAMPDSIYAEMGIYFGLNDDAYSVRMAKEKWISGEAKLLLQGGIAPVVQQPIDDIKDFIYRVIEDDMSADVEFSDYVQYWKSDNQGEITALISTVIPFDILRKRIACQWTPADKIGNSFVADSQNSTINSNFVYWISIDYDN